jgi:hypothetical protein
LVFQKRSRDESGKCSIVEDDAGTTVIGVVFELDDTDLPGLDRAEGAGQGYDRTDIRVHLQGRTVDCLTYRATDLDPTVIPYGWYRQLVLAGLLEHGAPDEYLDKVRAISWARDPNPTRRTRLEALKALRVFRETYPLLAPKLIEADDA